MYQLYFDLLVCNKLKLLILVGNYEYLEFVGKGTTPGIQCTKDADG